MPVPSLKSIALVGVACQDVIDNHATVCLSGLFCGVQHHRCQLELPHHASVYHLQTDLCAHEHRFPNVNLNTTQTHQFSYPQSVRRYASGFAALPVELAMVSSASEQMRRTPRLTDTEPVPSMPKPETYVPPERKSDTEEDCSFSLASVPSAVLLGPNGGRMEYHTNANGLNLCSYWYPAEGEARASVIAVHGNGVYLPFAFLKFQGAGRPSTYEGSWVEALNKQGISVAGIDMQSCGRSGGLHGYQSYLESWHDMIQDELDFVDMVRSSSDSSFGDRPVFFLGASLGGCIATHCALKLQDEDWFKGCVLMAPMLSLERASKAGMNPVLEPIGRRLAQFIPSLPVVGGNLPEMKEKIPYLLAGYQKDPGVYFGATRIGNATQYLEAAAAVMASASTASFPMAIFHSPTDTLTDPDGSREFLDAAVSTDKFYTEVPGMWHDLIQENGNEAILHQVLAWIDQRADKPAPPVVDLETEDCDSEQVPLPTLSPPPDDANDRSTA